MHAFLTNLIDEATAGDARPSVDQALVEVFGFGCSVKTIGTSIWRCVVAVSEICGLMHGPEMRGSCRVRTPSVPWRPAV